MFCPNCGNNCGDAKFCSECGTRLMKKAELTKLPVDTADATVPIPCGNYSTIARSDVLTLYETELHLSHALLFKKVKATIPYNQIRTVIYIRPLDSTFGIGQMLFRWDGNMDIPIPEPLYFQRDHSVISIHPYNDLVFDNIFYALKALAPAGAEFKLIRTAQPVKGVEELAAKVDADIYFNKFAPYRDKAAEEIRKRTGATKEAAKALVARIFDERQQIIYDSDPDAAILDLSLVAGKQIREAEAARKKRAEQWQEHLRMARLANTIERHNDK